ncbi:MAG: DUF1904 family protein [Cellulosilyticaceae bacterium]
MPMLRIRGIEELEVKVASTMLIDELAEIVGCPRDYFTIEMMRSHFVMDGQIVDAPAMIEVAWFDRGQAVRDQVAACITKHLKGQKAYLEVYFVTLQENAYYENGVHF